MVSCRTQESKKKAKENNECMSNENMRNNEKNKDRLKRILNF